LKTKKHEIPDEFYSNLTSIYKKRRSEIQKKWNRVLPFNEL